MPKATLNRDATAHTHSTLTYGFDVAAQLGRDETAHVTADLTMVGAGE